VSPDLRRGIRRARQLDAVDRCDAARRYLSRAAARSTMLEAAQLPTSTLVSRKPSACRRGRPMVLSLLI
jgi:hypothetical protein